MSRIRIKRRIVVFVIVVFKYFMDKIPDALPRWSEWKKEQSFTLSIAYNQFIQSDD